RDAVVIDPVLDYDPTTQLTSNLQMQKLTGFVTAQNLNVSWILETHAHADHLSAAVRLKKDWPGAQWAMGQAMTEVFANFSKVWNWPPSLRIEAMGVDRWLRDGES